MRKKILFGGIFVLALILLMPSIPAIQQKTVEDKVYNDFIANLKDSDLEKFELLNGTIEFPIVFYVINLILIFRYTRGRFIMTAGLWGDYNVYLRGMRIMESVPVIIDILEILSNKFGWYWNFDSLKEYCSYPPW